MDSKRYLEEDFNIFVNELINGKRFNDDIEEGIARYLVDNGFDSLSEKQKFIFEKAISLSIANKCSVCGEDIPWSEMSAAEDNGWMCNSCAHFKEKLNSY